MVIFRHKSRMGAWCSPVNTSPCHGEDRGFESLRTRHKDISSTEEVFLLFGDIIYTRMFRRNPFEQPAQKAQTSEAQLELQKDQLFMDDLDRRLGDLGEMGISIQSYRSYPFLQAKVTDLHRKRPAHKEDLYGVALWFDGYSGGYGRGPNAPIVFSTQDIDESYFLRYKDVRRKLAALERGYTPEQEKMKRLTALDTLRRKVHDEAAQALLQVDSPYHTRPHIEMDQAAARKIFEVLIKIWDIPRQHARLSFSEGLLDDVDLGKLKEKILAETGTVVEIDYFVYGAHADAPRNQYEFTFPQPVHPETLSKIRQLTEDIARQK